ncbi:response regulator [Neobacillus sp. Marseille-QA0830]
MIKVVIVEDDPMVAELNKRYLEQIDGFILTAICKTVEQAFETLKKEKVELLLLDIFMPGKNGLELLSSLRKQDLAVDVIVISAASDTERIQKALRLGAVDYLIKPFEFDRFNAALTAYRENLSFINEHNLLNQEELDQMILHKEENTLPEELPKGLSKETLRVIWNSVVEMKATPFSTDDIVLKSGISRVSVRKYLKFLNDIGVLEVQVHYGTVGRPYSEHRIIEKNTDFMQHYL